MSDLTFLKGAAYLCIPKFEKHLYDELGICIDENASLNNDEVFVYKDIVYKKSYKDNVFWKRLGLENPFIAHFKSISEGAALLKRMQRNWAMYPFRCIRRAELIKQKLPFISSKLKEFPYVIPLSSMGFFTLLDENTIFGSSKTSSPLPLGELHFVEDKINPPSRAYLKLYEALCLLDYYKRFSLKSDEGIFRKDERKPFNGLTCIDAGACPGGWTWVLDSLGANIIAIDRSPLIPSLMEKPNIKFISHDAFTLLPSHFEKVDWVFSDVICYPPRLLEWVHKWLDLDLCSHFVCTIKMQGEPDMKSIREFFNIPHSKIVHLTSNKHELTWLCAPFL